MDGGLHESFSTREAAEALVEKHRDHHEGAKQKARRRARARASAPAEPPSVSDALRERHAAAVAEAERAPQVTTPTTLPGKAVGRAESPRPEAGSERAGGEAADASERSGGGSSDASEEGSDPVKDDEPGARAGDGRGASGQVCGRNHHGSIRAGACRVQRTRRVRAAG